MVDKDGPSHKEDDDDNHGPGHKEDNDDKHGPGHEEGKGEKRKKASSPDGDDGGKDDKKIDKAVGELKGAGREIVRADPAPSKAEPAVARLDSALKLDGLV